MNTRDKIRSDADVVRAASRKAAALDQRLVEMLVCPVSKQALDDNGESGELISRVARLAYPVRNGIPVLLVEEARPLADHEV